MAVYKETILLKSHGKTPTYVNITPQVREAIEKSGMESVQSFLHIQHVLYFLKNLYMIIMKQEMSSYRKI